MNVICCRGMKSLYGKWLPAVLTLALAGVAADDFRLHHTVQEYRAIGTMLTEEEKPAEFFLNQYRERVRELREPYEDEHAVMCLGIAAHMGSDEAQSKLASYLSHMAEQGDGDRRCHAQRGWLKKAAEQGKAEYLADYAASITNPVQDWQTYLTDEERAQRTAELYVAIEVWRRAAELGNLQAQGEMARFYHNGYGCEKNLDEALRWALMAHEAQKKQRAGACFETRYVGELYLEMGKPEEALPYLEYCAMYGDPQAEKLWRQADSLIKQRNNPKPEEA